MMDRLREGVNSIAVKIILGLIILSFVFAGVGSYIVGGTNNAAAKVGNTDIPRGEFEMAYQNERNRMQAQLGDYFSQMLADPAYVESFRKSVLDRMINDVLLDQQAEALGLRISDEQVRSMILEMPQFQSNGQFDQEIYQASLRRAGFSPDTFAEYMRRELVREQLLNALQTSEFTLPGEVQVQGELFTQTRDIRTVAIDFEEFAKNVELTDEEIQDYYKANQDNFTRPEQAKVAYIELSAEALKTQIEVSDEEVQKYYDEHLDKYSSEEQRRVAHILVEGDDEAKAQAILDELNNGAEFATLAEEKSDDFGSAEIGGDLGWIERDVMDPAFEEAAFALENVGDVSELVKSDFGYHIIKLEELKDSVAKPFADVAAEIKQELVDQKAVDKFYELQNELERVAFEYPDSLDDASKAVDQEVKTTGFVSQADAPEVLRNPAVMQAILSPEVKEDGLNSEAIEVAPEHIVVVRVEEARPETVLPLDEVKDQVVTELSRVKGEQGALELGTKVVAALKEGKTEVLAENNLAFGEKETVDRRSPFAQTVFAMAKPVEGKPVYAQSKDLEGNVVVIELDAVNSELDSALEDQVAMQMERSSSQQDLSSVLAVLRANTDIEYFVVSN
ncbi:MULTISPECIES: peptidylprolyl isomerase [Vibrio]|uniref:Periplasmic chaperone PpiD n=1 Tax=Vibrio natriegens NBRC 15636 = ATCC 14048 = DSM 759 TaxID=1219067 RepID=A0AAN1CV90_VIBNA|nr:MULTISPECIES: peptidylprolyl isomerase [Vibrio]MEE3880099.1 peptidylprolyl isomerase [Vibrio sp. YYF0003]ALR16102.1 peptidylprolyl isomerase [Vibrio natriegens NBRC 15636 = ATCC 14048 = DSM 759]ANQ12036.1 peptidylprolyl isomerase [Vibrio natriegens NBRC 15636 = ATCC 14048 = DSM 759]ANQ25856.1 peptidylprolyl isomerase [Vibrio natriegens]AXT70321.1 peptidylprolyl isomerase [Vibrio sp. dhg]